MREVISLGTPTEDPERICQIQVKDRTGMNSRSFTIHGTTTTEAFSRIVFLFEQINNSQDDIKIIHHRWRTTDEKTTE